MPVKPIGKVVFYKSSGESLAEGADYSAWTPNGVREHADKIQRIHARQENLGIRGLVTVSGAGNIVRGEQLREQGIAGGLEDAIGRLATVQNTLVIASALGERKVPHTVMLAPGMHLEDATLGRIEGYSRDSLVESIERGVVLIGGGKGTDGNTTDAAIMHYAGEFRRHEPDTPIVVLKGTKVDGVFDADPKKTLAARRYDEISAEEVLERDLKVVDKESLVLAIEYGLDLLVYEDSAHDLTQVLSPDAGIGTVIRGVPCDAIYASAS